MPPASALNLSSPVVAIELDNFALGRHESEQALRWYELARKDPAVPDFDLLADVERQIQLVRSTPPAPPMRNPVKE